MSVKFTVSDIIPATAREIYDAWLDSAAHAAMTGGAKAKASPQVGGAFAAFDAYALGVNLELVPGKRIVQSWRTSDFAKDDPDSVLAVALEPAPGGTLVTLLHSGIPGGQDDYKSGWQEYYFAPMKAYFGEKSPKPAKAPKKAAKAVKKTAKATRKPAKATRKARPAAAKKTARKKPKAAARK